jgi:small-conductance mechanosensitive channel
MALLSGITNSLADKSALKAFLEYEFFHIGKISVQVYNIFVIVFIVLITKILLRLFKGFITRKARQTQVDTGKAFAVYQIVEYLAYVIMVILILQSIGFSITLFLAGGTALFIGIGLGFQDLFRDIVAGFIILSERTVTVGDVVEVAGMVAQVKEIHLRTTTVYTRDDIVVIIPNTKLIREQVVNWSQNRLPTRFHVEIRVDYGFDARSVESTLLKSVKENKEVVAIPAPSVMLRDLNENYMVFHLYFFSRNLFRIERLKSDIRFEIERLFRQEGIRFALPKREISIKAGDINTLVNQVKKSEE